MDSLTFLYGLQKFGIKLGLEKIEKILQYLNNPERDYPIVHIAGTNGKGSTAAMIASVLTASGYRTGLYTSPHLVDFNERIRIDGVKIPDEDVAFYTSVVRQKVNALGATLFEATTAMAFKYFSDRRVDIAVVETGLGGRFDATNVVTPLASVITTIGFDHTQYLGTTLRSIAMEKAGIIKPGVPCFTGVTGSALGEIRKTAGRRKSKLVECARSAKVRILSSDLDGLTIDASTKHPTYRRLFVSLAGEHQKMNAQLSLLVAEYLRTERGFNKITDATLRRGLSSIGKLSGLRGRIDRLCESPRIIADVAHNPPAITVLVRSLRRLTPGKFVTVFGVMRDKDYEKMLPELALISRLIIAVTPKIDRALPSQEIVRFLHRFQRKSVNTDSVETGLQMGLRELRSREPILIVGSHVVVGEAMHFLGQAA